jgi:ribosomal protein L35AE/L33A
MKALIINFRGGFRTRYEREAIIRPLGEVKGPLVGRKVAWHNPHSGSRVLGKIVAAHGSRGYRARFRVGLPGWAIGSEVEVS